MKKIYFYLIAFLFLTVAKAQIVNIPDANFKAKLLAASWSVHVASTQTLNVTIYTKIDTNNDGQIQQSEANLIKYLDVRNSFITNLEGINSFTNLENLKCDHNQITDLNLSGLTNLKYLECSVNQINNLNVTNLNNLIYLGCGGNLLQNISLNGLTNLVSLYCLNNLLTTIDVSDLVNMQVIDCTFNQLTNLNVSNLPNLQELKISNNQLQNINVNGTTNVTEFTCLNNQLTVIDVSNMNNLQSLRCQNNFLTFLDISATRVNVLYCSNNLLTKLILKNNDYTWYNLDFSNNPNLKYVCSDEADFTLVQNKINQYGYTSCNLNSYCSFNPGGTFYYINGTNKFDFGSNGCDALDFICPVMKFELFDGFNSGLSIANTTGNYSFPVPSGTHTLTPQLENPTYFNISPTSSTVAFPTTVSPFTQNFCITPNGVHHDLEVVVIPIGLARPGFDAKYKIKYKNKGNQTENTTINFNYNDAILDYVSSSVASTTQATGTLTWNVGTLTPLQSGEILVALNVNSPTETPPVNAGNTLSYSATANGVITDETPDDNFFTLSQQVFNSFDPNDKNCLEGATINPSMIGKYVHYKIKFENKGTFPAQNIVVKDMIDTTKFDMSTLQMTDASHSCVTRITNPEKVEFIFENINLPFNDATNDGYVVFKIKTKGTLAVNSTISNAANIYFDYNFPILTNTATATFTTLQNDTFAFDTYFTLYPNPALDVLNITTKQETQIYNLTIYNTIGQQFQTTTSPSKTIDISGLKTGSYFVKVLTDKGVSSSRFEKK